MNKRYGINLIDDNNDSIWQLTSIQTNFILIDGKQIILSDLWATAFE